jgi:xylulokinase
MGNLLLGIDVGTYSSTGVLVEIEGTVLKTHVIEHEMAIPQPGWAEQDADQVWWHAVVAICRVLLEGQPYKGEDVGGVAVSAIGPCMLPLDSRSRPLRPGILYGVDTRASQEIDLLNQKLGVENVYACTMKSRRSRSCATLDGTGTSPDEGWGEAATVAAGRQGITNSQPPI